METPLPDPPTATTYRVVPTLEDVAQGTPGSPFRCPVARAARRVLPPTYHLAVATTTLRVSKDGVTIQIVPLPPAVQALSAAFDREESPAGRPPPFDLEIVL